MTAARLRFTRCEMPTSNWTGETSWLSWARRAAANLRYYTCVAQWTGPLPEALSSKARHFKGLDDLGLTRLRRTRIGFVFQFFNLLPTLTVAENVALPLLLAGVSKAKAEAEASRWIDRVGLASRRGHYPHQLSGGEMQRTALARAVAHQPALVLADEPTGNLDSTNSVRVLELLRELNDETGVAVLLATHSARDRCRRQAGPSYARRSAGESVLSTEC